MQMFERILLYATATVLGLVLMTSGETEDPAAWENTRGEAAEAVANLPQPMADPLKSLGADEEVPSIERPTDPPQAHSHVASQQRTDHVPQSVVSKQQSSTAHQRQTLPPSATSPPNGLPLEEQAPSDAVPIEPQSPFVLCDASGAPRIEMTADEGGSSIQLRDSDGHTAIVLRAVEDGVAEIALHRSGAKLRLWGDPQGNLSVRLEGASQRTVSLHVGSSGDTEISAGAGPRKLEVLLRTDTTGEAEIGIRAPDGQPAPLLTRLPSGECNIAIRGSGRAQGPAMTRFMDGLSEIAIRRADTQAGPALLQLPSGEAIVAVRRSDGRPAASLVAAPDGSSVIAAESRDGRHRAALRISRDGLPSIGTTQGDADQSEPEEKPGEEQERPPRIVPTAFEGT